MNHRDDCAETLFATNFEEIVRSCAYEQLMKGLLRIKGQARARQYL